MPEINYLALRQADQARTDFAALESELEVVHIQLSWLPTRAYLCSALLIATGSVWSLLIALALLLAR